MAPPAAHAAPAPLRVAVTLEQCWHRVPGGVASTALEAVRALTTRAKVDLIGVSAHHRTSPPEPWTPSIPVRGLPLSRIALYESWHRFGRPAVERATGPVDVIYVTGMAMPPRTVPLVVTVHDLAFLTDPGHSTKRGVRFFNRAIDLARERADLVCCPSQDTLDDCVANGFDRGRLRLVPWGVDPQRVAPGDVERVRATYRLRDPYVLWTGTVEPRKNLPTLLEAFRKLDRHGLDLVLVGPKGWNEDLGAHLGNAAGRVRVLGFVPTDDLRALYAGAEVFCLPSLREGFGMPLLEAMAQGAPTITSSGTATEEVAGDAAVLVDPHDPDGISDAMAALLDDPDERARRRQASFERAAEYPWSRTASELEDAFAEVAEVLT